MPAMVDRTFEKFSSLGFLLTLGLVAGCGSSGGGTDSSTGDASTSSASSTGSATGSPTTDVPTGEGPGTNTEPGTGSISGTETNATTVEPMTDTGSETQSDPTTGTDTTDTTGAVSSDGTSTGTTDGTSTSTSDGSSTGDGSSSTGDGCVKTEPSEVTCDDIDNDCDGNVDNIDAGGDGICDCLNIAILGNSGFAPNANFEAWLEDQGTAVQRTLLLNNPGAVTPAFLAKYDLVLVDRIERALSPEEAAALEKFVKQDGRGMITLIGYNFDNNNPVPERDRANTVLSPFGLAYQGPYFGNGVIPTFDQNHPISKGIFDVNFAGGIEPVDTGKQGTSAIFATVQGKTGGLAHETAMQGGRVIVWGDEWLTFDSDWQGYADVQEFWVNMVKWAKPKDFCGVPQ
jgi:hypothetical protein